LICSEQRESSIQDISCHLNLSSPRVCSIWYSPLPSSGYSSELNFDGMLICDREVPENCCMRWLYITQFRHDNMLRILALVWFIPLPPPSPWYRLLSLRLERGLWRASCHGSVFSPALKTRTRIFRIHILHYSLGGWAMLIRGRIQWMSQDAQICSWFHIPNFLFSLQFTGCVIPDDVIANCYYDALSELTIQFRFYVWIDYHNSKLGRLRRC